MTGVQTCALPISAGKPVHLDAIVAWLKKHKIPLSYDAVKRLGRYSLGLMGAVFKKPQRWQNVKQAVETLMVSRPGKEITFDLLSRTLAKLKLENVSAARMREWGQHKKLGSYRPAAGWQERLESLCSAVYVGPRTVEKCLSWPSGGYHQHMEDRKLLIWRWQFKPLVELMYSYPRFNGALKCREIILDYIMLEPQQLCSKYPSAVRQQLINAFPRQLVYPAYMLVLMDLNEANSIPNGKDALVAPALLVAIPKALAKKGKLQTSSTRMKQRKISAVSGNQTGITPAMMRSSAKNPSSVTFWDIVVRAPIKEELKRFGIRPASIETTLRWGPVISADEFVEQHGDIYDVAYDQWRPATPNENLKLKFLSYDVEIFGLVSMALGAVFL